MNGHPKVLVAVLALLSFLALSAGTASAVTPVACPNEELRTGPSARLPECRAYEMVSPLDKNGGDIEPGFVGSASGSTAGASPDGSALAYNSRTTFGSGAQGGSLFPTARSVRTVSGWDATAIAPPSDNEIGSGLFPILDFLSENLKRSLIVTPATLTPDAANLGGEFHSWGLYRRDETGPLSFQLVSSPSSPLSPEPSVTLAKDRFAVAAANPDMSLVVFNASRQLLPEGPPDGEQSPNSVYLWSETEGLSLVSVFPPGTVGEKVYGGASAQTASFDGGQNLLSEDGRRVFFTVGNAPSSGSIFVREDPSFPSAVTRAVGEGSFIGARASDGSVAFFSSSEDGLVRWDADAAPGEELTQITPAADPNDLLGAMGLSEDADTIYFVSREAIDSEGTDGEPNLYVWHGGVGTEFIATMSAEDSPDWEPLRAQPEFLDASPRSARVTPDGQRLLFSSRLQLSDHDTDGTAQIYLYDRDLGEVVCVSCGEGPGPSASGSSLLTVEDGQFSIPRTLPRNLSADGRRAFFETSQALLPADVNDRGDVYMWSADGDGLSGSLSLISTGKDSTRSLFMNASSSGDDVFFASREKLVPLDTDNHVDAYDARIDGGFAYQSLPDCEGELCQGEPGSPGGPPPVPSTSDFKGAGNAQQGRRGKKKCRNGKVKRKGKCVKRQHQNGGDRRTGK